MSLISWRGFQRLQMMTVVNVLRAYWRTFWTVKRWRGCGLHRNLIRLMGTTQPVQMGAFPGNNWHQCEHISHPFFRPRWALQPTPAMLQPHFFRIAGRSAVVCKLLRQRCSSLLLSATPVQHFLGWLCYANTLLPPLACMTVTA